MGKGPDQRKDNRVNRGNDLLGSTWGEGKENSGGEEKEQQSSEKKHERVHL